MIRRSGPQLINIESRSLPLHFISSVRFTLQYFISRRSQNMINASAGSISIPSTRYPSTFGYRYRIDTFYKWSIPKKGGNLRGKNKKSKLIYTIFLRVITTFSFLFSFWTQNHFLLVFFLWNISALKWGTRVSFEFGLQLLKHIGIQDDKRRLTSTRYRIDTFRYCTRYRIDTKIKVSTRH